MRAFVVGDRWAATRAATWGLLVVVVHEDGQRSYVERVTSLRLDRRYSDAHQRLSAMARRFNEGGAGREGLVRRWKLR